MLITHIIIALGSLLFATYMAVSPSKAKFNVSYAMVLATILSGSYLVVAESANLLHTCVSGLAYLSVVLVMIAIANKRFAKQLIEKR